MPDSEPLPPYNIFFIEPTQDSTISEVYFCIRSVFGNKNVADQKVKVHLCSCMYLRDQEKHRSQYVQPLPIHLSNIFIPAQEIMKNFIIILAQLFFVGSLYAHLSANGNTQLTGKVTDKQTGETLIGVSIYLPDMQKGAVTDENGIYKITGLAATKTIVQVSYVGHQTIIQNIDLSVTKTLDFELKESSAQMDEIVVTAFTGNSLIKRTPSPMTIVSQNQLLQSSSTNIIDAIAKQPGMAQVTTGAGISKPVIRGLGFNRVVVIDNGVRQEGQQWGEEHGIEIDGQTVGSVEILKGPASLMYGSDAMAGVINMLPAPMATEGVIKSDILTGYQTNNGMFNNSIGFEGNKKGFVWNARYSDKRAHAYKNKYDGYVFGSGLMENALSGTFGISKGWGFSHLTLSYYNIRPDIITGERDPATGRFTKQIAGTDTPGIADNSDFKSYGYSIPYQRVRHYKAVIDNNIALKQGNLKIIAGYQQNQRKEFENPTDHSEVGLYFQLHTVNYDVRYTLPELYGYKISAGISGMYQHSLNKGSEFMLPEYNLFDAGTFVVGSKNWGRLDLSGGLRIDRRHNNINRFTPHHNHDHHNEAEGHDEDHENEEELPAFSRNFNGFSASLGLTYQLSNSWHAKLNLSKGFRAPNINELAAHGSHGGALRFDIGNKNLKPENSLQLDFGLGYSSSLISGELSLFVNRINHYIFSEKMTDQDGETLITDGNPTYQFVSGNARLAGGEVSVDIHPVERIHFLNTFSYVNSEQLHQPDSTRYLPMTPAPRFTSDIRFDIIRHGKKFNNMYISVGCETNLRQSNIYKAFGTETPTPSYTLLHAGFGTDIVYRGHTVASVYLTADNLADKAYQNHLSRLKYADNNLVTNRQGVYNMGRSFGFRLLIPISY